MGPVDLSCDHDMALPAPLDMTERNVGGKWFAPVAIEIRQNRHRIAQCRGAGPGVEIQRLQELRSCPLEGPVLGCNLAEYIIPVRCRGTTDDCRIRIKHVERHDIPEGRADIFTGACCPADRFQHRGDAHQPVTSLASRDRDPLFQAFARTKVSASHQGAEHGDRRVGKRGLQLAQRGKQYDPSASRSHLLESLGGIARTFASELRQAWFVPRIDRNTGNAGPADQRDLLEDFGERGGRDAGLRFT